MYVALMGGSTTRWVDVRGSGLSTAEKVRPLFGGAVLGVHRVGDGWQAGMARDAAGIVGGRRDGGQIVCGVRRVGGPWQREQQRQPAAAAGVGGVRMLSQGAARQGWRPRARGGVVCRLVYVRVLRSVYFASRAANLFSARRFFSVLSLERRAHRRDLRGDLLLDGLHGVGHLDVERDRRRRRTSAAGAAAGGAASSVGSPSAGGKVAGGSSVQHDAS